MSKPIAPCILPSLSIPMEACGPEGDEHFWLHGSFDMWGAQFFLEAWRVRTETFQGEEYQVLDPLGGKGITYSDWINDLVHLRQAFEPDGGFQTVNIDGADYVVTFYPASDS